MLSFGMRRHVQIHGLLTDRVFKSHVTLLLDLFRLHHNLRRKLCLYCAMLKREVSLCAMVMGGGSGRSGVGTRQLRGCDCLKQDSSQKDEQQLCEGTVCTACMGGSTLQVVRRQANLMFSGFPRTRCAYYFGFIFFTASDTVGNVFQKELKCWINNLSTAIAVSGLAAWQTCLVCPEEEENTVDSGLVWVRRLSRGLISSLKVVPVHAKLHFDILQA